MYRHDLVDTAYLNDPAYVKFVDPRYIGEMSAMASGVGLSPVKSDPLIETGRWHFHSHVCDHGDSVEFNSSTERYYNISDRPITYADASGVDRVIRHVRDPRNLFGKVFFQKYNNKPWFIVEREDVVDLAAFKYFRDVSVNSDLAIENISRLHNFLMGNYRNRQVDTPYRVGLLNHLRQLFTEGNKLGEKLVITSYIIVDLETFADNEPKYVIDGDFTLMRSNYVTNDTEPGHPLELSPTNGKAVHPTSIQSLRRNEEGVLSRRYKSTAGRTVRVRSSRDLNAERSMYLVQGHEVTAIPTMVPAIGESEGVYINTMDPITGNVSETVIALNDVEALAQRGIHIGIYEANNYASEVRAKRITEDDVKQKEYEREAKAKTLAAQAAEEAAHKHELQLAKAKLAEGNARADKYKLISTVVGAISATIVAVLGLVKLFTPSRSGLSAFLKIS